MSSDHGAWVHESSVSIVCIKCEHITWTTLFNQASMFLKNVSGLSIQYCHHTAETINLFAGKPTRYPDSNKIPVEVSAGTERTPNIYTRSAIA